MARIDGIVWTARPAARDRERIERSARLVPVALVLLALLHGLLYLVIVPPWQHYDEPTHFEYARLIALWNRWPAVNEIDLATDREIADSMYRFRFWRPGVRPALFGAEPPNIGFSEKVHPPLYYAVAAVPVRWLLFSPIEAQLYAARMVAVLLYALIVACAWRIATILAPDRPAIQIAAPLILILVPAFVDQMSAVNNDALVNFSTAALLLGCVLLIRDGLRPLPLALAGLSLAVALATKRTAVVGVVLFALALFWSLRRRPVRWWVWAAVLAVLGVTVGLGALEYGPRGWSAQPWLVSFDRRYLRLGLDQGFVTSPSWRKYPLLFDVLFTSFWARFGWGSVAIGGWADWALRAVVLASVAGLIVASIRSRGAGVSWRRRVVCLFIVTVVVAWLAAIVRFEAQEGFYVPRGRYIHLAIVPTIWLLALGVERLAPRRWRAQSLFVLTLLFALIDVAAWGGVLSNFYYRR
jgi:4-amino-4-deoxy-L-arabinose transferase-like glycosyltransferase